MALTEHDRYRYSQPAIDDRVVEAHALLVTVEERIAELWRWRAWYRQRADWSSFTEMRHRHEAELRALVRLARASRRLVAAAPDPIDVYRGRDYHDVQAR